MSEERLSELLKGLRKQKNISQETLAARMGVHRNNISRWEQAPGGVKLEVLSRWCAALGEPLPKVLRFAEKSPSVVHQ